MPPVARHDCYCKPAFRAREQRIKKYYRSRQFVMIDVSIFVRAHYPVNAVTVEHAKTSWRIPELTVAWIFPAKACDFGSQSRAPRSGHPRAPRRIDQATNLY